MRMNGGETVSARVPGGRPAGSDQDTQASINRVDTGRVWCSEESGHTHDDLELPSADAVLEIILLPVDDIPTERRSLILGVLQTGISAGYIVVIALSSWILPHYGWRTLYYVSALPVVFALAIKFAVPEPASWLASRAVARKSERGFLDNRYRLIFSNRQTRMLFILWTFASIFILSGFYGLNNWLPTYLEKELHIKFSALTGYMIGTYVVAFVGKIFAGSMKVGERMRRLRPVQPAAG